jgi:hypothetical protein
LASSQVYSDAKKPKILITPAAKYVMMDGQGDLYTVLNAVQQHNEAATGYRIKDKRRSSHEAVRYDTQSYLWTPSGRKAIKERRMNIIAIEPNYAFEFS